MNLFNNPDLMQYFSGGGTLTRNRGMAGLGDYGGSYGTQSVPTTTPVGGGLTSAVSAVSAGVTGVLQAENAQNMINQEKSAAAAVIPMIPLLIVGGLGLLYLMSSKK